MSADPLRDVLHRLDCEPPLFHAEEAESLFGWELPGFVSLGLLRETTPGRVSVCRECGGTRMMHVVYVSPPASPERIPILPCPMCGPHRISGDELRRWEIPVRSFLDRLSGAAKITGPPDELLRPRLWRLGKATWAGRPREVFLARNLTAESRRAVKEALAHRPKAVLLFPTEGAVQSW